LATSLLAVYPNTALSNGHSSFTWQDQVLPAAWANRTWLTPPLTSALATCVSANLVDPANAIHCWGFGKPIPNRLHTQPGFFDALQDTLIAFLGRCPGHVASREQSLTNLLRFKGLGIAVASKWVCFVDPNRNGIYDSRVSIALRNLQIDGRRAFPIVGRRPPKGKKAFQSDTQIISNPARTARAYLDYLEVLALVASATGTLCPAEVEMALFMLGNVWANGQPSLTPLPGGMWN
jgi:hypothetical protein